MRNRPTPSTSSLAARSASSTAPMLASSCTLCPPLVRPAPPVAVFSEARALARARIASRRLSSGSRTTVPCAASIAMVASSSSVMAPSTRTRHGRSSWAAMIAVWLVGPPSSVTMPTTWLRSREAVSAGARSLATTMVGLVSSGRPGSGTPSTCATIRSRTSRRSVTRSARYGPLASSTLQKPSTAWSTAVAGPVPALMRRSTSAIRPGSCAINEVASSTAAVAAWAAAARTRRLVATYWNELRTSGLCRRGVRGRGFVDRAVSPRPPV